MANLLWNKLRAVLKMAALSALALGLFTANLSAQQDQQEQDDATGQQQNQPDRAVPSEQPSLSYSPQSTERQNAPQNAPQNAYAEVPASITLPPGTVIAVRTSDWLSSDHNQPGDGFSASLEQPLIADGWVVARRGQSVLGRVSVAQKAGRVKGVSQLGVELNELTLVDGQVLPLRTQLLQSSAGTSNGRDVAAVAGTTATGAAIGAIAGRGEGAGIGAAAGAVAGIIGVLVTPGRPTVFPPETLLTFRLEAPLTISTQRSRFAFQPVAQQDYDPRTNQVRPRGYASAGTPYPYQYPPRGYYPAPYPYPYVYSYPYAYPYAYGYGYGYYPAPFYYGFYGSRVFGPRFEFHDRGREFHEHRRDRR